MDIHLFSDDPKEQRGLSGTVGDELVLAALLAPLAGTNLRAPIRDGISISDASEEGVGSAVSSSFVQQLSSADAAFDDLALDSAVLGSADGGVAADVVCTFCSRPLDKLRFACHSKCHVSACSVSCWARHEADLCVYRRNYRSVVWVIGCGLALQIAEELARAKLFLKFSPARDTLHVNMGDADYLHSVDFLCAPPVSRGRVSIKLIVRLVDKCWHKVVNGTFSFSRSEPV